MHSSRELRRPARTLSLMSMHDPAILTPPPLPFKGRGALSNPEGRFEKTVHRAEDDGWARADKNDAPPR
ncbi:MAG: hypothetical protein ACREP1_03085, partial [Rhodanobacteraceae bacterium]